MGVKRNQAATGRRTIPTLQAAILCLTTAMIVVGTAAFAFGQTPSRLEAAHGIVAIDPGHGGKDMGGRGTAGTLEKEVNLALARELAHLLEPTHRVILTRSDDYDLPLRERTAIANHQKADLFLSLHTGASYRHSANEVSIYYYRPADKKAAGPKSAEPTQAWNQIQMAHLNASQNLAQQLKITLSALPGQPTARVVRAPRPGRRP